MLGTVVRGVVKGTARPGGCVRSTIENNLVLLNVIGSVSTFCGLRDQMNCWVHSTLIAGVDGFSAHESVCGGLLYMTATKEGWVGSNMYGISNPTQEDSLKSTVAFTCHAA